MGEPPAGTGREGPGDGAAGVRAPKDATIKDTISNEINNMEKRGTTPDDAWKAATESIDKAIG
ncbi:hypothetical protein ABZ858_19005 [Streptomyces sp. NPDC047017]|uniref:hypothetical protein n=1 Tax=Streptomyces sp. NPDC047017 TaxID=3155024 RepID=UPI0033E3F0D9